MSEKESNRIEVYLDNESEPIAVYRPPGRFTLDTNKLDDGEHQLRIIAYSATNKKSLKTIPFTVRNGPGIDVDGLKDNDVLDGKISLLINAFGGSSEEQWEPERAETPAPIPTWAWVLFIFIFAWSIYYFVEQFSPTPQYSNTPTYGTWGLTNNIDDVPNDKETAELGAQLYRTSCASCHQENGQGLPGIFPPLTNDSVVSSEDPSKHIETVIYGSQGSTINGIKYVTPMPAWGVQLSDKEIAAVINHERSNWGNNGRLITVKDVEKIRNR